MTVNIKSRINARKVVLSYVYQHCFFRLLSQQKSAINEALFIDNIFASHKEQFSQEKDDLMKKIDHYVIQGEKPSKEVITEFMEMFFDEWTTEEVDYDYLFAVLPKVVEYEKDIATQVDKYATTFNYAEMDTIDKSIFLLGYTERKVLNTPKEIILNELIEIAKRYSDEGAPKLINGIMHKILSEGTEQS